MEALKAVSDYVDLLTTKTRGVLRLTRWREFIPFVIPLTVFGALLGATDKQVSLDWRLLVTLIANSFAVAYAFMINDIEDAPDDAREAHRAARNAITNGELTPRQGWAITLAVGAVTFVLYAMVGVWPFVIGVLTMALAHFYSWKPIRLKAWPVTDILSHSLMLSGLLFLAGFFAYSSTPGLVWLVAMAATLLSVYGQLYNQLRDFDMDKAAGLKNTAIMVGPRYAKILMYTSVAMAAVMFVYALWMQVVPVWLLTVPLLIIPIFYFFRPPVNDMRGTTAVDVSGSVQMPMIIVANVTIGVWLVAVMIGLA
jgi:4-hydroxybenzoate polyprenyltransferase